MGQKIHPIGFRLPVTRNWSSRWYAGNKNFASMLAEDIEVREFLKKKLKSAAVSRITIDLKPVAQGTELSFVHDRFFDADSVSNVIFDANSVSNLDSYVELFAESVIVGPHSEFIAESKHVFVVKPDNGANFCSFPARFCFTVAFCFAFCLAFCLIGSQS